MKPWSNLNLMLLFLVAFSNERSPKVSPMKASFK